MLPMNTPSALPAVAAIYPLTDWLVSRFLPHNNEVPQPLHTPVDNILQGGKEFP